MHTWWKGCAEIDYLPCHRALLLSSPGLIGRSVSVSQRTHDAAVTGMPRFRGHEQRETRYLNTVIKSPSRAPRFR